jgi:hypothetical protein
MYYPMSKLNHKPITKSLGSFLKEKWSETTKKQFFLLLFILEPFRHPQIDLKRYPKASKWAGCRAQCVSLKKSNRKNSRPILLGEMVQTNPKTGYGFYAGFFGPLGTPKQTHKCTQKAHKWARRMGQCLSIKLST